jgi:ligand-binding sensor domain-containing protein
MGKNLFIIILSGFLTFSCNKEDFPERVRFDISGQLLEGKHISCIDLDNKGNIYIASNKELYCINSHKSYTLDFPVLDLAIAPDETVWVGTNGGGLGHLTGGGFTWYTVANSGLPRDYVRNVEIGLNGNVWFSSCAFKLGGLGIYDGKKFEFLTPENSPLNQNIIEDIEIDLDGNVFIATSGTVGKTNIYRISDNSWDCLGDETGMFYWVFSFTVGISGTLYLVEDFSLSSSFPNLNTLFEYKDNNWVKIENIPEIGFSTRLKADKRNYCWLAGYGDHSAVLLVYNGESWSSSPEGMFPDDFITTFEIDNDNNVWVGTNKSGVFILNQ